MSFKHELTDKENSIPIKCSNFKKDKTLKKQNLKLLELKDDFYENLFLAEMEFKMNPNKESIPLIIRQYCRAVEYFSSIQDEEKAKKYKILIDLFLNDPNVINLLENDQNDKNLVNVNNENNLLEKILISNKRRNIGNIYEIDDINFNCEKLKKIYKDDQKKCNKLMDKYDNFNKIAQYGGLIKEEIKNQQNNFQRNLSLKKNSLHKRKKSNNKDKIIQSIQNAFINEKNENAIFEEKMDNLIKYECQDCPISPIILEQNSSNKGNSNVKEIKSFSFSNDKNNSDNNTMINISVNKKSTSIFEPLTPDNIKFEKNKERNESKSSNKHNLNNIIEETNETNDFSLNVEKDRKVSENSNNKIQIYNSKIKSNNILSNETKESCNINISNSSLFSKNLNESLCQTDIFKHFRIDFNEFFESIKNSNIINNKQLLFYKDIKNIIENYINDYNQYLNDKIFIKFINHFSSLWDDMFKKYVNISEIYNQELKNVYKKLNDITEDKSEYKTLMNMCENLRNEKENEISQCEDRFSSQIESIALDFKKNYNNSDKGILILNEKFEFIISKKLFDMINNI